MAMNRLAAVLALLGLLAAARPLLAQDEATIKGAFIMCGMQQVLIACDDLVQMPDLNNVVRANAYATRAGVLARLGRIDGAKRDLDQALKLDPSNKQVLQFQALLLGAGAAACEQAVDREARLKACDAQ